MSQTPKLSLVIPSQNRQAELRALLGDLSSISDHCEIIVVLNPWTDSQLFEEFPHVRFLGSAIGANAARAEGTRRAMGEWIWFLDDDCRVPQQTLDLLPSLLSKQDVDAFAGVYQAPDQLSALAKAYFIVSDLWLKSCTALGTPFLVGGNFLIQRRHLNEQSWPENIEYGGTELQLNIKVQKQNLKVVAEPNLKVIHHIENLTTDQLKQKALRQGQGSQQALEKHLQFRFSHRPPMNAYLNHELYLSASAEERRQIHEGISLYDSRFLHGTPFKKRKSASTYLKTWNQVVQSYFQARLFENKTVAQTQRILPTQSFEKLSAKQKLGLLVEISFSNSLTSTSDFSKLGVTQLIKTDLKHLQSFHPSINDSTLLVVEDDHGALTEALELLKNVKAKEIVVVVNKSYNLQSLIHIQSKINIAWHFPIREMGPEFYFSADELYLSGELLEKLKGPQTYQVFNPYWKYHPQDESLSQGMSEFHTALRLPLFKAAFVENPNSKNLRIRLLRLSTFERILVFSIFCGPLYLARALKTGFFKYVYWPVEYHIRTWRNPMSDQDYENLKTSEIAEKKEQAYQQHRNRSQGLSD